MALTQRVLLGLGAGIACGVFFGEKAAPLQVVATGFVKLLQMTVLPYVVLSIVGSVGSLKFDDAKRLGLRVALVIASLWVIAATYAVLLPLSFPEAEGASFFSASMVEDRPPLNLVDLYIPANPFHSLANNIVPAIVLFSLIIGIALIGVPEKERLIDVLKLATETVSRATRFVVKLTPYGIFAIAAPAAGTLSVEQLSKIEIYFVSYIGVSLLLTFWVLPGLLSVLTPISIKDVFGPNRGALITAFVAGDLFIVLPSLMEALEQTLRRREIGTDAEQRLPEVIVPASFNFPHSGKLLSLSFVLFAGWLTEVTVAIKDYPQLVAAGVLSLFGSLNTAIPFLLDMFRIPADTFQLYLATGVLNARFGTLLAAVHVIVVGLLGSSAIAGAVRLSVPKLIRYVAVTLVLTVATVGGLRILFSTVWRPSFDGRALIERMGPLHPHPRPQKLDAATILPEVVSAGGVFDDVRKRGVLRVGYFDGRLPFIFETPGGDLKGLEVEAAYLLAADLGVEPRFVRIRVAELPEVMAAGVCDIVMSGVALTPRRQGETLFSDSYLDQTLAFAVLDHRRQDFATWDEIRSARRPRLAVPNIAHYLTLLKSLVPTAEISPYEPDQLNLDVNAPFDAYVVAAEYGAAQTLLNPRFTIVVPRPGTIEVPVAYPVARRDERWREVVNTWVELRRKDGSYDRWREHWLLGKSSEPKTPRWSILRDVLHWVH